MSRPAADRLIDALKNPALYDPPADSVELMETHISRVLLAGDYAYKIKKPVDLGFVDFTTLERRRRFCHEELRLNRRLAPDLYLDVIPITGTPEQPEWGGTGEPIEFAVKMKRFGQDRLLNHALEQGTLSAGHIDALVEELAAFHSGVEIAPPESPFGTPESILAPVEENFRHLYAYLDEETTQREEANVDALREQVTRLQRWSEDEFARLESVFRQRKQGGCVRECHGDMHLGNMLLDDGGVLIFDCIEFNESFRWIDLQSEVAFLVMDLEDRGRPDYAHRFLGGYLERTGDYDGLRVLPFYLTYRALVRAKVACLRLDQEGLAPEDRKGLHQEFHGYLDLAERYTQPAGGWLAINHGFSGSGKTTGTLAVVEQFGALRIRSDIERKRLFGLAPLEKSDSTVGENLYTAEANRRTYLRLQELAKTILEAGFPVLVDATFLKRQGRRQFRALAAKHNVPFLIFDFQADRETLRRRVAAREESGRDASEANTAVLEEQFDLAEPLSEEERRSAIFIDTDAEVDLKKLLREVEQRLG